MIDVDLYLLNYKNVCQHQLQRLPARLSITERHTWQTMTHPDRQQQYLLSRGLLRQLLAERLQRPAANLQFCQDQQGKPRLHDNDWHFNISHSGHWLVLALCQQGPLGVDIELGKRRRPPLPLARRFYAPSEYEWLCTLPEAEQENAFYRLWSRKEAVLKAHGGGIAAGLEKVRFIPNDQWRLDNRLDAVSYQVQDWPFANGWLSLAAAATSVNVYHLDQRLNCQPINPMLIHTLSPESKP